MYSQLPLNILLQIFQIQMASPQTQVQRVTVIWIFNSLWKHFWYLMVVQNSVFRQKEVGLHILVLFQEPTPVSFLDVDNKGIFVFKVFRISTNVIDIPIWIIIFPHYSHFLDLFKIPFFLLFPQLHSKTIHKASLNIPLKLVFISDLPQWSFSPVTKTTSGLIHL